MTAGVADWAPPAFPERKVLVGQWCRLEPLSADHHTPDIWRHMAGHDDLWPYLFQAAPKTEREYHDILAANASRTDIVPYAIIDKADGVAKGHLMIMEIRPAHGVFEVGSITYAPAMQRTRMATEAIYLVGDYGFAQGYRRYEWKCNNLNEPSKRAALRFGFTYEGLFRQHMVVKGLNRDTAWYSMIDSEWPAVKARFETWLRPENFNADGTQKAGLGEI